MNINKFITESIDNTDNDELAVSDDETAFSDTLLQLSLPAAISAGLGALNLRKVESGEIYEVDWEEVASNAGQIAGKVGNQITRKISEKSEDVSDFGQDFIHGVKKVAKRAAEDVADKFQGKGPISGLLKVGKRKVKDSLEDLDDKGYKMIKSGVRTLRDKLETDGDTKGSLKAGDDWKELKSLPRFRSKD